MNPVVHQVRQQCEEAHSNRPEVKDDYSSERSVFCSKQFTRHDVTWQNYSLTTNHDNETVHSSFSNGSQPVQFHDICFIYIAVTAVLQQI